MSTPETNTDEKRWSALQLALHEQQLERSFSMFRSGRFEPILIKGWAANRSYPDDVKRFPGDIDLCVEPERYQEALAWQDANAGSLPIDLHEGFRHFDTVSYTDLFSHSQLVKLNDTDIRILSDEDHLRVLAVHWLTDGGAYKEKLKDIHYAVENRRADFDWDRCLNAAGEKRRRWVICAILLANRYFGTDISDTPVENERLPEWVVRTVEKEWANDVRLKPLKLFMKDPRGLWRQIRKRIPPNALQATITLEGDFDKKPRIYYQTISIFARIIPSIKRSTAAPKK